MAITKHGGGIASTFGILMFCLAGLAGTAASLYAMVVAYMAGASAQASIDGCPKADTASLVRASMQELSQVSSADDGVINVDEEKVSVNDVNRVLNDHLEDAL